MGGGWSVQIVQKQQKTRSFANFVPFKIGSFDIMEKPASISDN